MKTQAMIGRFFTVILVVAIVIFGFKAFRWFCFFIGDYFHDLKGAGPHPGDRAYEIVTEGMGFCYVIGGTVVLGLALCIIMVIVSYIVYGHEVDEVI